MDSPLYMDGLKLLVNFWNFGPEILKLQLQYSKIIQIMLSKFYYIIIIFLKIGSSKDIIL